MTTLTKKQKVDLRQVKRHKLYPVLNEYIKEIFEGYPLLDHFIIESPEQLQGDLSARFGETYKLDQIQQVLEAYADERPRGGYLVERKDFYLPVTF